MRAMNYSFTNGRNNRGKTEPFFESTFILFFYFRIRGEGMGRKELVREVKAAALARMEDAARTAEDFEAVVEQWNHLDDNRERKERYWEKQRDEKTLEVGYTDGIVIPAPISHYAWREAIKGDFLSMIFDNAMEMWQLIEDADVSGLVKNLTDKQKEVLFLSVVRLCSAVHIACYHDKTDRAVRKLLAATLDSIRDKLAPLIREQMKVEYPKMTLAKREFVAWYDKEVIKKRKEKTTAIDSNGSD